MHQIRGPPSTRPTQVNPSRVVPAVATSPNGAPSPHPLLRHGSLTSGPTTVAGPPPAMVRTATSPIMRRIESTATQHVTSRPPPTTTIQPEFGPLVAEGAASQHRSLPPSASTPIVPTPARVPSIRYASSKIASPTAADAQQLSPRDRFKQVARAVLSNNRQTAQQQQQWTETAQRTSTAAPPLPVISQQLPAPVERPLAVISNVNGGDTQAPVPYAEAPYSHRPCPFLPSDEQVEALFEIESVNYAVYEGLKQRRPDLARRFDDAVHQAMLRTLAECGISVDPMNLWTQVRPGLLGAAVLRYDSSELKPYIADAEWPLRIRVVVRCMPQDTRIVVGTLERVGQGDVRFTGPFDIYQTVQNTIVGPCVLYLIDHTAPESCVDGMRQHSPRRAQAEELSRSSNQRLMSMTSPSKYDTSPRTPARALYPQAEQQLYATMSPREYLHSYSPRALMNVQPDAQWYSPDGRERGLSTETSPSGETYRFIRTR